MAEDESALVKMETRALDSILKDWDISFGINGDILTNILRFSVAINSDIPIRFYEDKIFSNFKSPDNILYTQITIQSNDVSDYKPGLGDTGKTGKLNITYPMSKQEYHDHLDDLKANAIKGIEGIDDIEDMGALSMEGIESDISDINPEETYEEYLLRHNATTMEENKNIIKDIDNRPCKLILFDARKVFKDLERLVDKDDRVVVRIDTINKEKIGKRIEFHAKGTIIHAALIEPDQSLLKMLDSLPKIIGRVRNDPKIKKAIILLEVGTFARMCFKVTTSIKTGMRDIDQRVLLTVNKERVLVLSGDKDKGVLFEIVKDPYANTITLKDREIRDKQKERVSKLRKLYDPNGKYANNKEDDNKHIDDLVGKGINMCLSLDVDEPQRSYVNMEYILPYLLTRSISYITMEIRTDKPIVLDRMAWNGINIMMTIAPRNEEEND